MTPAEALAEVRARLDVDATTVPDSRIQWCIGVAVEMVNATEPAVAPFASSGARAQALVDEATVELAVKIYDLGARGTIGMDPAGEWVAPSPSATRGLINAVAGILAPATAVGMTGGFA